jgi:hypothetical protein
VSVRNSNALASDDSPPKRRFRADETGYGCLSATADECCLRPPVEQKLLLGSVVYWHPPLLTGEAENPAFQFGLLAKHDGAGGVTCATLLKVDGMVTLKP